MATTFKTFLADDVTNTRTLLHENIPITGTLVSGTYADSNIKNFSHKRFQSVYDYNYLSSSANHIFDISLGISSDSAISGATSAHVDINKKLQMYNTMAQILAGHDVTGSILKFDRDGDLTTSGDKHKDCVFFSFSRLLSKDEIKKGSVELIIGTGSYSTPFADVVTIADYGAASEYRINSPAGEYGILYTGSAAVSGSGVGLVFYQAGIMVLTASVFAPADGENFSGSFALSASLSGSDIQQLSDVVRHRIKNINFNNTVELNSSIYFCRINHNEFNYSSNPTYLSESRIRVKEEKTDEPVSYITTVGLYSSNNELLAVAKLSEPLKKTPQNSLVLRTRLDF
jgi:hypothetical protein